MPAYNTAAFIGEALASAFAQTYNNYEVVVVNDASPDTPLLEQALQPYLSRITYLIHPQNLGPGAARNTAIRHTEAPWILLLDSDDKLTPDGLAAHIRELQQHPDADVIYGDGVFVGDEENGRRYSELAPSSGDVTLESLVTRRCNVFISALVRRDALMKVGLFDEQFSVCADFELWCRLAKAGSEIRYHRDVVLQYRRHPNALSRNEIAMYRELIDIHEKLLAREELSSSERRTVAAMKRQYELGYRMIQAKRAILAGNFDAARGHVREARGLTSRPWLRVLTVALLVCPGVVRRAYGRKYGRAVNRVSERRRQD